MRCLKNCKSSMAQDFFHQKRSKKTDEAVNELLSSNFALEGNEEQDTMVPSNVDEQKINGRALKILRKAKLNLKLKLQGAPSSRRRPASASSIRSNARSNVSGRRSRPQSARTSRPSSRQSNRSSRGRPMSADSRRGRRTPRRQYEFSPIRSTLTKLYNTTAHLMPKDPKPVVTRRPQSARSTRSRGADSARNIAMQLKQKTARKDPKCPWTSKV